MTASVKTSSIIQTDVFCDVADDIDLGQSSIVETLIRKVASLLFAILSRFGRIDVESSKPQLIEFKETLEEMNLLFNDTSLASLASNQILKLDSGLEMFSDYLYRVTKNIHKEEYLSHHNSLILVANAFYEWSCCSNDLKSKLLISGLLYSQVRSIEILNSCCPQIKDTSLMLSLHINVLLKCFVSSHFATFYTFSDINWFALLSQSIEDGSSTNLRVSSLLLASLVVPMFFEEQQCTMFELKDQDELNYILESSVSSSPLSQQNAFPLTLGETFLVLRNMSFNHNNRAMILTMSDLLLALLTSCLTTSEVTALCKLLIEMTCSDKYVSESDINYESFVELLEPYINSEDLCLATYSESVIQLLCSKGVVVVGDFLIQNLFKVTNLLLQSFTTANPHIYESYFFQFADLSDVFVNVTRAQEKHVRNALIGALAKSGVLKPFYEVLSKVFNVLHSISGEMVACLTKLLKCMFHLSKCNRDISFSLLEGNFLSEHIHQLTTLIAPEHSWYVRVIILLNLAIILNCVNNVPESSSMTMHIDWAQMVSPLLKSRDQSVRILAFFVYACVCPNNENQSAFHVQLNDTDVQHIHDFFVTAMKATNHLCTVSNQFTVSVVTILKAITMEIQIQKIIVEPQKMIDSLTVLLSTGNKREQIAACKCFVICQKINHFRQLCQQPNNAITDILNSIYKSDDEDLKYNAEKALGTTHGEMKLRGELDSPILNEYSSVLSKLSSVLISAAPNYAPQQEEICHLLTSVCTLYRQSSSLVQLKLVEYTISTSIVKEICDFVSNIVTVFYDKVSSTTLLQCLNVVLSFFTSWTDISRNMRYAIMETEVLIYVADLICTLSSITDDEMEVIKFMVTNGAILLSNCSQEKEFGWFYTSPGMIDWPIVLENWMASPFAPLRFTAKVISGYMSHVLEYEKLLKLLCLSDPDIKTVLQMLYQSVVSEAFCASGFGCKFSTKELLVFLINSLCCKSNLDAVVHSEQVLPPVLILLNCHDQDNRTVALRLLLELSRSKDFRQILSEFSVLEMVSKVNSSISDEDSCLKFLCRCAFPFFNNTEDQIDEYLNVFYDCDSSGLFQVKTAFMELVKKFGILLLSKLAECIDGRKLNMSSEDVPILKIIDEIYTFWRRASHLLQVEIAKEIANSTEVLCTIHKFILKAYDSLTIDKDNEIGSCFTMLLLCVIGWMQKCSSLCSYVNKSGLLYGYIGFHQRTSLVKETNVTRFTLHCQLTFILLCVQELEVSAYFDSIDWFHRLSPLSFSKDKRIKLLSKLIAGHIAPALSEEKLLLLKFDSIDVQNVIDLLHEAANASYFQARGDFKLTASTLLQSINCLLACSYNFPVASGHLLTLTEALLCSCDSLISLILKVTTTVNEQTNDNKLIILEAYKFLFFLLKNKGASLDSCLTKRLCRTVGEQIKTNLSQEICAICESILLLIETDDIKYIDMCLTYANGYYVLHWWNDCIEMCDKSLEKKDQLVLLKGKALFAKFLNNHKKLKMQKLSVDMKKKLFDKVFSLNKEVINLFGKAYDQGYLDDEASVMLDRAMMDCIFEANMLDSCSRCYCCRKNLKAKLSNKSQQKLIKSHIISKAILEEFAASLGINDKQVLFARHTSIGTAQKRAISPGELAYFMLCRECEEIISTFGETQFLPNFFRKIYFGDSDLGHQFYIEYGPWLYQFCVGLLFRAMHWGIDDFVNSETIYKIFKLFQAQILDWPALFLLTQKNCSMAL